MSDRERLIEIIEQARREAVGTVGSMNNGFSAWYADKLLADGVAPVQGWIPVTERLPEPKVDVLYTLQGWKNRSESGVVQCIERAMVYWGCRNSCTCNTLDASAGCAGGGCRKCLKENTK